MIMREQLLVGTQVIRVYSYHGDVLLYLSISLLHVEQVKR